MSISTASALAAVETLSGLVLPSSVAIPTTLIVAASTSAIVAGTASLTSQVVAATSSAPAAGGKSYTPAQKMILADRVEWNERAPIIYLAACAICFAIYLLMDQPRVLARLFSSPFGKLHWNTPSGPKALHHTSLKEKRTIGGDLWKGWIFQSGTSRSPAVATIHSISSPYGEKAELGPFVEMIKTPGDAYASPRMGGVPINRSDVTLSVGGEEQLIDPQDHLALAESIPYKAPIYQSHRRMDSRPDLKVTMPGSQTLRRNPSTASVAPSMYSQESTYVDHEAWKDDDDDKISQMKKTALLHSAITQHSAYSYGPMTGITEAPLLSAVSPSGNALSRMAIGNASGYNQLTAPPHVPQAIARFPMLARIFLMTPFSKILSHLTLPALFVCMLYGGIVAFATFFKCTNWDWNLKTNPLGPNILRPGMIAVVQIPIIIALGGRNSPVRYLLGGGESRAIIRLHKLAGRICFACMLLHVGDYSYKWGSAGKFMNNVKMPFVMWGLIAVASLTLMVITSLPPIRKHIYSLFMISHILGLGGLLLGLAMHIDLARPYCIAGAVLYGFDLLCRAVKTRVATADLKVMKGSDSTLITIPSVKSGWRAGQHLILRVPALPKAGGLHFLEGHVFSIASAPETNGLVLIVKRNGDWTKALYDLASKDDGEAGHAEGKRQTRVILEGPYGGPGNSIFASYSCVMLVAGGSGITHTLGVAHDLISKAASQDSVRANFLEIVWVVRTQEVARPLMATFRALVEEAKRAESRLAVRFHIYVTRCPSSSPVTLLSPSTQETMNAPFALSDLSRSQNIVWSCGSDSRISVITGSRPDLGVVLEDLIDSTLAFEQDRQMDASGCTIAVCGPGSLVDSARNATRLIDNKRRLDIGGIELLEEHFSH